MFTTKLLYGAWVATLSIGTLAAGWGLVGNNSLLFAQGNDPFGGDSTDNTTIAVDDDPFGASPAPKTRRTRNTFNTANRRTNTAAQSANDPFGKATPSKPSIANRMRKLGHYGIGDETAAELRILEALHNDKTELEFIDEPLQNVAAVISERHNIPILFDKRAMEEAGINPNSDTANLTVSNVRLQSALNILLRDHELTSVVRDEVLMITTIEASEEILVTRLYPLASHWPAAPEKLIQTVTATTAPDSWATVGGPGTLSLVEGGLFVSNTQDVHLEVSKMFAKLEKLYLPKKKSHQDRR